MREIINELDSMSLIESFFFIRYWEHGPHIRLRVLPKRIERIAQIKDSISKTTEQYFFSLKDNTKFSYEFNNYVQEVQRYGGMETISIAERQFHKSSETVITLIHSKYNCWDYNMAMSLAIQMHLCLSKFLFLNRENEILFFKKFYEDWLFYATGVNGQIENLEIPKIGKLLDSFKASYEEQKNRIESIIEFIEKDLEEGWQAQWKSDCCEIASLYDAHEPTDKYLVYSSLMHMTNNRLGIHISDESFIAFLIFKGLENKLSGSTQSGYME
jgi:thiopeptide-type bacteriocin biosynthesis protein